MADYVYIQNYSQRGRLAIAMNVFDDIIMTAIEEIKGVKVKKAKDVFNFKLHNPIHCNFQNGRLVCDIEVIISSLANVNQVCLALQEKTAYAISAMTEYIPFSVNVKVRGIESLS